MGHDDVLVHENMIREESEQDLAESEDNASLASFNGGTAAATTTFGGTKSNCSTLVTPGGQDGGKGAGSATADSSQTSLDKAVAGESQKYSILGKIEHGFQLNY